MTKNNKLIFHRRVRIHNPSFSYKKSKKKRLFATKISFISKAQTKKFSTIAR